MLLYMLCKCVVLLSLLVVVSAHFDFPNVDVFQSSTAAPTLQSRTERRFARSKIHVLLTAHIAVMSGRSAAFKVIATPNCGNYTALSKLAKDFNCTYATNGGYFVEGGAQCGGNVVVNGTTYAAYPDYVPSFGIRSSDKSYVVGMINSTMIDEIGFDSLISGGPWLVLNGTAQNVSTDGVSTRNNETDDTNNNINNNNAPSNNENVGTWHCPITPRTAIGLDADGNLVLVQVDGIEGLCIGMGMQEFADYLAELGLFVAINLDGGGSSESYYDGKVLGFPHCHDTFSICERNIPSGTCIIV